jgi:hypothetical protein
MFYDGIVKAGRGDWRKRASLRVAAVETANQSTPRLLVIWAILVLAGQAPAAGNWRPFCRTKVGIRGVDGFQGLVPARSPRTYAR